MNTSHEALSIQAPDMIEPIQGWRGWIALMGQRGMTLHSPVHRTMWSPMHALRATCSHHPSGIGENCTCGIYASHTAERAARHLVRPPGHRDAILVIGQVALWGTVIDAEHGVRASHAYPTHLWIVDEPGRPRRAHSMREHLFGYGVPVASAMLRGATAPAG